MTNHYDFGLITADANTSGRAVKYATCVPCDERMTLSQVGQHVATVHAADTEFPAMFRDGDSDDIWPCTALVDHGYFEGEPVILECAATAHAVGLGWRCTNGHEHLGIEVEWAPFGPEWQRDQLERMGGGW